MIMVLLLVTLVKWIDSVCLKEKSNVNPSIAVLFKVTSVGRIFFTQHRPTGGLAANIN